MIKKPDKEVTRKEFNALSDSHKQLASDQKTMASNQRTLAFRMEKMDKNIEDSRVRAENQKIRDEKQQKGIDELLDDTQGIKWFFFSSLKTISIYIGSIKTLIYGLLNFRNWFNIS